MAERNGMADDGLNTGVFRLPDLPEEVRLNIFESLVPDPLPIGTGPSLPADVLASRAALRNLCRTSPNCRDLALPLLYRYIIITDYIQMVGLLVNLIFHNDRRRWMRRLAVLVEVPFEGYDVPKWDYNSRFVSKIISQLNRCNIQNLEPSVVGILNQLGAVLPQLKDVIERAPVNYEVFMDSDEGWSHEGFPWESYEPDFHNVNGHLLQLLVQLQTHFKDILITVPRDFEQPIGPTDLNHRIMGQFQLDLKRPASDNPLGALNSIRKQPCFATGERLQPWPLVLEYLSSKDWEFLLDDGNWFFAHFLNTHGWPLPVQPPTELAIFSNITDLGLYRSLTHPAVLRVILSSCHSLKTLCYTTNAIRWVDKFKPLAATEEYDGIAVPTLQQALDEVRETLTDLRLGWDQWGPRLTQEEEAAVAPHRVDVSLFPRLTSIEIDQAFVR